MQVALMRSLSCAGGDFVCPGAANRSQIGKGLKSEYASTKTTLFSDFLSTMFLFFLSCSLFLMQQTPVL